MAGAGTCTAGDRMRAVIYLAVHELRARWQGWAVLVLLVAVAGGAVLTAAAGALRTDTAYQRFLKASKASDVLVAPDLWGPRDYFDALARLPITPATAEIPASSSIEEVTSAASVTPARLAATTLAAGVQIPPGMYFASIEIISARSAAGYESSIPQSARIRIQPTTKTR